MFLRVTMGSRGQVLCSIAALAQLDMLGSPIQAAHLLW